MLPNRSNAKTTFTVFVLVGFFALLSVLQPGIMIGLIAWFGFLWFLSSEKMK